MIKLKHPDVFSRRGAFYIRLAGKRRSDKEIFVPMLHMGKTFAYYKNIQGTKRRDSHAQSISQAYGHSPVSVRDSVSCWSACRHLIH